MAHTTNAVVEIGTTATTLYEVPAGADFFTVGVIHIGNASADERTVTVYAVPAEGAASDANALVKDLKVPAGDFIQFGRGMDFGPGVLIQAVGDAAGLNGHVSGIAAGV